MRTMLRTLLLLILGSVTASARAQWTVPTPEELSMTSQPEVPGAGAVYLDREEVTDDKTHAWSIYVRLKVLTERGKRYANVELRQYHVTDTVIGYTVGDIEARTIHSDGTIIPFTGKPFEKLIERTEGFKENAKVFTLPDVEVGSILEYRYKLLYDDHVTYIPEWLIQSELYTRKAHYLWNEKLQGTDSVTGFSNAVSWTEVLPKGFDIVQTRYPPTTVEGGGAKLELAVHDIPPIPEEEFMPPVRSLSYRVLFHFSSYKTPEEFWKNEGKTWSNARDKFIGPGVKVKGAVQQLVAETAGSAPLTQEQKLRKIYAAVMQLDNTSFYRTRQYTEDQTQGLTAAHNTDDILERKRGSANQITELFVAMARAAGMKAYVMAVTSRDRNRFTPAYLSFNQLNNYVAIVNVDGKEQFFDPGARYCPYQQMAWLNTFAQGIRQTDSGSVIGGTPGEPYTSSRIQRVANLTMDEHGEVTGTVKMTWVGAPALRWREFTLRRDNTTLKDDLVSSLQHLVPSALNVSLDSILNLDDYEQPLVVTYNVKGQLASATGKRLLVPGDIFTANVTPAFPHDKREYPVYFDYPYLSQDAIRVNIPASLGVESLPTSQKLPFDQFAVYSFASESTATSITVRRELALSNILYTPAEYPKLRAFYNQFQTKDQEPAVLRAAGGGTSGN